MKQRGSTILLILIFFVGLSVLLYPAVSDYWNSKTQTRAIASYQETVSSLPRETYEEEFAQAEAYNLRLHQIDYPLMNCKEVEGYEDCLNVRETGVMGYVEIPKIEVQLPVYHGTSDAVLSQFVGHVEGTDLPTGGLGVHSVLSAHRGLPSARLFTDLDQMEPGDLFTLSVLNREMTYQVDQILIVEPTDTEHLAPVQDRDLCTLVTCTPYGINSHRLLVRGTRIEKPEDYVPPQIRADAGRVDPALVAPLVAAPMLLALLLWLLLKPKLRRKKK